VTRGTGRRAGRARVWVLLLVLLAAAAAAFTTFEPARRAVQGAWSAVAMRRVERHADLIRAAAEESGVDPCLLAAIMYAESRGRPDAVSKAGALGLFQLMETSAGDAARRLGVERPTREELLSDSALNARLAASHLAWLIENEGPDVERVLVAYNAGRTKLHRWIRAFGSYAAWRAAQAADGDSEVLAYARSVLELRERFAARGRLTRAPDAPAGAGPDASAGAPAETEAR
jgi:soluble lytic murein transglycosylase-like protein